MISADAPDEPHPHDQAVAGVGGGVEEPKETATDDGVTIDPDAAEGELDGPGSDSDDPPTLLEVLRGDVAEEDIPPEVAEQIDKLAQSARSMLPRVKIDLSPEFTRSMEQLRQTLASPMADAARRIVEQYNFDTGRVLEPVIKQLQPSRDLINARIRAQIAASLPTESLVSRLDPLLEKVARKAIPKDFLRGFTIPPSALRNVYGPEFERVAAKLFDFQRLFKDVDWEALKTGWYPPNWDPDRGIEQFATFIELAREEGLPMAWVPNTELTYLLLESEDADARSQALVEHASRVISDCRGVLAEFESQTFLVGQLGRALDACEAGFHESAQSHAASIIDTTVREVFTAAPSKRWSYTITVKTRLHDGEEWRDVPLRMFRLVPTSVALLNVLKEFWTEKGDSVPTMPNRHAAAHAVTREQYNQSNAIKFLMLATAVLAEVEHGGWTRLLARADAA